MLARHNELTVTRGETWTMSKRIQNIDGSPYIISNELTNPYWLITVASARYRRDEDKVFNKWLNLSMYPRFRTTRAENIADYGFTFEGGELPSGFNGDETMGYANIAVFYEKSPEGVTSYKYWEYNNNEIDDFSGHWVPYECVINTSYPGEVTALWIEQNYYYSISLVSGPNRPNLKTGEEPIIVLDLLPILSETKLFVKSNLKGIKR